MQKSKIILQLVILVLVVVVVAVGMKSTSVLASGFSISPSADSYVDGSTNHGTSTQIRVDGSPVVTSFLRFNVSGISGTINSVKLRVYNNSAQSVGYTAYSVADNSWNESTIVSPGPT